MIYNSKFNCTKCIRYRFETFLFFCFGRWVEEMILTIYIKFFSLLKENHNFFSVGLITFTVWREKNIKLYVDRYDSARRTIEISAVVCILDVYQWIWVNLWTFTCRNTSEIISEGSQPVKGVPVSLSITVVSNFLMQKGQATNLHYKHQQDSQMHI